MVRAGVSGRCDLPVRFRGTSMEEGGLSSPELSGLEVRLPEWERPQCMRVPPAAGPGGFVAGAQGAAGRGSASLGPGELLVSSGLAPCRPLFP